MRIYKMAAALLAAVIGCVGLHLPAKAADTAVPGISSLSAVVYAPSSDMVLYEKDADTPRPMASTTKLMTALLAAERLNPADEVAVPAGAVPVEGTQLGLAAGDKVLVQDLLAGLLLSSGNDAANALALLMEDSLPAFASCMNEKARQLGMTNSLFVTPSGLDEGGHSASARDMARLGGAVLQQPLLAQLCAAKTATVTLHGTRMSLRNHNRLLNLYAPCIGMKTGFTKKSGRCLVSAAEKDGVVLVVATLNGGDYWNDHIALYEYAFSLVEQAQMPAVEWPDCPVAGGTAATVPLTVQLPDAFVVRRGQTVRARVYAPAFVWAPVQQGQVVGEIEYVYEDRVLARVPVRAAQAVEACPPPSWFAAYGRRFMEWMDRLLA